MKWNKNGLAAPSHFASVNVIVGLLNKSALKKNPQVNQRGLKLPGRNSIGRTPKSAQPAAITRGGSADECTTGLSTLCSNSNERRFSPDMQTRNDPEKTRVNVEQIVCFVAQPSFSWSLPAPIRSGSSVRQHGMQSWDIFLIVDVLSSAEIQPIKALVMPPSVAQTAVFRRYRPIRDYKADDSRQLLHFDKANGVT